LVLQNVGQKMPSKGMLFAPVT